MAKLFRKYFENFAKANFETKGDMNHLRHQLNTFKKKHDFADYEILQRFPRKELKYFLRLECPTESMEGSISLSSKEVIDAGKRLRYAVDIPENFVCYRCSKKSTCNKKDLLPKKKKASVHDLLMYMDGLYNYSNMVEKKNEASKKEAQRQAEKVTASEEFSGVRVQQEEGEEAEESVLSEEDLEDDIEEFSEDMEEQEEFKVENNPVSKGKEIEDRYNFKAYLSAMKVIDSLNPILNDLKYHNATEAKLFVNMFREEQKVMKEHAIAEQEDRMLVQLSPKSKKNTPTKHNRDDSEAEEVDFESHDQEGEFLVQEARDLIKAQRA